MNPDQQTPALQLLMERRQQNQSQEDLAWDDANLRHVPLYVLHWPGHVPGLPVAQLLPNNDPQNDQNRHLWIEDVPVAFTAWRNRAADPWVKPPRYQA